MRAEGGPAGPGGTAVANEGPVRADRDGSVLTLTLDRPDKHNALSAEMVETLLRHVEAAPGAGVDTLVLRGQGPSFCAGFDLGDLDAATDAALLARFVRIEQLLQAVHHAPVATVALAHGRVFGAGADLVCAAAYRIGAPGTRFRLPGLAFGIVLGTRRLAARVGPDAARTIQACGATVDAVEALRLGLLSDVHATDDWSKTVEAIRRATTAIPPAASALFQHALAPDHRDADLAALTRSAAAPGLAERMRVYRRGAVR